MVTGAAKAAADLRAPPLPTPLPWRIGKSFARDFDFTAVKLKWRDNLKNNFSQVEPLRSCKGNRRTPVMKWAGLPWRPGILGRGRPRARCDLTPNLRVAFDFSR